MLLVIYTVPGPVVVYKLCCAVLVENLVYCGCDVEGKLLVSCLVEVLQLSIVTCSVTRHGVWIGNWIYWTLTNRNHNYLQRYH
jgi:hypothetical protein